MVLFRLVRPERLARPEGFRSLVDFITVLRGADVAVAAERVGAARGDVVAQRTPDLLPYYLLWSTAAAAVVLGALLHRWLYAMGFSKAQESGAALGAERAR